MALLAPRVILGTRVQQGLRGRQARRVSLVLQALRAIPAEQGLLGRQAAALLALQAILAPRGLLAVLQGLRGRLGHLARQGLQGHLVAPLGLLAQRVTRVLLVPRGQQALPAILAPLALREILVPQGLLATSAPRVRLAQLVHLVRLLV